MSLWLIKMLILKKSSIIDLNDAVRLVNNDKGISFFQGTATKERRFTLQQLHSALFLMPGLEML